MRYSTSMSSMNDYLLEDLEADYRIVSGGGIENEWARRQALEDSEREGRNADVEIEWAEAAYREAVELCEREGHRAYADAENGPSANDHYCANCGKDLRPHADDEDLCPF